MIRHDQIKKMGRHGTTRLQSARHEHDPITTRFSKWTRHGTTRRHGMTRTRKWTRSDSTRPGPTRKFFDTTRHDPPV
ncbi:hypothetical protein RHMOL_Rhmol05G0141500 [Rhododendron molle]|uniref:Uncharacterized protein n=1 Tax=Rhododendron molle TaxID=49168 RepID=A0ACC0NQ54_RHOML|nr:hypothetical protein RHMOL_Rhmol05G0141500 [Rhododendron molle]